jgi:hypothetical protein
MIIIALHNKRGGTGNTMLTAHLCEIACEVGLKVVAVSIDPQGELLHWRTTTPTTTVDFDVNGSVDADVIVMDVQSCKEPPLPPHVWIVPISDRTAELNAARMSDRLRGHLIWLGNMGYAPTVPAYLAGDVELAKPMPYSRALDRAAIQRTIIWSLPELAESPGAKALREALRDVLVRALTAEGMTLPFALQPVDIKALVASLAATVDDPPPPTLLERQTAALVDVARATLAGESFTVAPDIAKAVSTMAYKTVDVWLADLHRAGFELVCGLTTPEALARRISPDVAMAPTAKLGIETVLRFARTPGRTRVATLVQLAVACGQSDLIQVRPRGDQTTWPESQAPHTVN